MTNNKRTYKRYSIGFKLKVVKELEEEGLSVPEIRRRYGITGAHTIHKVA
jgi:transposase-like protein